MFFLEIKVEVENLIIVIGVRIMELGFRNGCFVSFIVFYFSNIFNVKRVWFFSLLNRKEF